MGWIKHILLGELGQSHDIVNNKEILDLQRKNQLRQSSKMIGQDMEIARLKKHNEELHLAITALSRYLIEEKLVDEEKLAKFIEKVDLEDGKADGRLAYDETSGKPKLIIPEDE